MATLILPWPPKELSQMTKQGRWSSDEDAILRSCIEAGVSHSEIAIICGRSRGSVKNRGWRLGLLDKSRFWTPHEIARLKDAYAGVVYGCEIDLDGLAAELGRHKTLVCRKAREFGLTDQGRDMIPPEVRKVKKPKYKTREERSKANSERIKRHFATVGHPRGALGMKHTPEAKAAISKKSKERWAAMTEEQKGEQIASAMKSRERNGTVQGMNREKASWGAGWREIGGFKKYYRSKWEANYARYLEWLKEHGEIIKWSHEPKTFWFEGIKRGCMSYLPDFHVVEKNGSEAYHEVKGWMDDRSKTKIRRMAKYHPSVKLIVIDSKGYAAIKKVMQPLIKDWEVDSKGR